MAFYEPKWASSQAECSAKWPGTVFTGAGTRDAQCVASNWMSESISPSITPQVQTGPGTGIVAPTGGSMPGWYWLVGAGALVIAAVLVSRKPKPLGGVRKPRRRNRR